MSNTITIKATNSYYWYGGAGNNGKDSLYVGYHDSSHNYRSRIEFAPSNWNLGTNQIITKAKLKLYPRGFFADSVRTADTWIAINNTTNSTYSSYNNACNLGIINDEKPNGKEHAYRKEDQPTVYTFDTNFLTRLNNYYKNKENFSIYIGCKEDTSIQGIIFTGINPSASAVKNLYPRLELEYETDINGTITTSTEGIYSFAQIKINNPLENYTYSALWKIGNYSQEIEIDSSNYSSTFVLTASEFNNANSLTGICIIKMKEGENIISSKIFNLVMLAPSQIGVSWDDETSLIADNSETIDFKTNTELFISGYTKPYFILKAKTDNGTPISNFLIDINSCGIIESKTIEISSDGCAYYTCTNPIASSKDAQIFIATVYAIDENGKFSSGKTFVKEDCLGYTPPSAIFSPIRVKEKESIAEDEQGEWIYASGLISWTNFSLNELSPPSIIISSGGKTSTFSPDFSENHYSFWYNPTDSMKINSAEYTFSIKIIFQDKISKNSIIATVPSAEYILHIKRGGKALGLGAAASENDKTIYCGWKVILEDGITDSDNLEKNCLPVKFGGTGVDNLENLELNLDLEFGLIAESDPLQGILTVGKNSIIFDAPLADIDVYGFISPGRGLKVKNNKKLSLDVITSDSISVSNSGNQIYIGKEDPNSISFEDAQNGDIYFRYED